MGDKLYTFSFKKGFKRARKENGYTQQSFADSFKVSIETVRNWEQGRNIPEMETLQKLCNFFQCGTDYLFGIIECETRDIQFIHDETGLSKDAIKTLKEWNRISKEKGPQYAWARNTLKILNNLLAQGITFAHNVLLPIADYIIYRFKYDNETFRAKDNLDKHRLAHFIATEGLSECIKNIYFSENPTNGLSEYISNTYFVKNPKKTTHNPKRP